MNANTEEIPLTVELLPCPFCGGPANKRLTDGPKRGFIGCFTCMIGLPFNEPYGEKEIASWNARATQPATPLCAVHQRLEGAGRLKCEIGGNNCVACSLNERAELLKTLTPFAATDGSKDSLQVLQGVIDRAASQPSTSARDWALARLEENESWWRDLINRPQFQGNIFWQATFEARAAACRRTIEQVTREESH